MEAQTLLRYFNFTCKVTPIGKIWSLIMQARMVIRKTIIRLMKMRSNPHYFYNVLILLLMFVVLLLLLFCYGSNWHKQGSCCSGLQLLGMLVEIIFIIISPLYPVVFLLCHLLFSKKIGVQRFRLQKDMFVILSILVFTEYSMRK